MGILSGIIWIVGLAVALGWMWGIRNKYQGGDTIHRGTILTTLCMLISLFIVTVTSLGSFHLFWMYPVGWFASTFLINMDMSQSGVAARIADIFGGICCLGLNEEEVRENTAIRERFNQRVMDLMECGYSEDEIREILTQEKEQGAFTAEDTTGLSDDLDEDSYDTVKSVEDGGEPIWSEFYGRQNTYETLAEKARMLGPILFTISQSKLSACLEQSELPPDTESQELHDLTFDVLFVLLHITDRVAFQHLEVDQRNQFVDQLCASTAHFINDNSLYEGSTYGVDNFIQRFGKAYHEFQDEYSQFPSIFAEKDEEAMGGTVMWEFAKSFNDKWPGDQNFKMTLRIYGYVSTAVFSLELPSLLTGANAQ
jgi:hypothetical protein